MTLKLFQVLAVILMAVQLGVSYAHFMQMPGKLGLPLDCYILVQNQVISLGSFIRSIRTVFENDLWNSRSITHFGFPSHLANPETATSTTWSTNLSDSGVCSIKRRIINTPPVRSMNVLTSNRGSISPRAIALS